MEQVFKDNPKLDVAYKTADGKYFFLESDAINHANALKNKEVKKVTRENRDLKDAAKEVVTNALQEAQGIEADLQEDKENKGADEKKNEPANISDEVKDNTATVEGAEVPTPKTNKKTKEK